MYSLFARIQHALHMWHKLRSHGLPQILVVMGLLMRILGVLPALADLLLRYDAFHL